MLTMSTLQKSRVHDAGSRVIPSQASGEFERHPSATHRQNHAGTSHPLSKVKSLFRSATVDFSTPFLVLSMVFSVTALVVSGYLAYVGLTASAVVGCDGGVFNCEHVLSSRWSKLLGIPVSIPAVGLYSVMIAAIFQLRSSSEFRRRVAATVVTAGALAAATAAAWFVSLQVFSIGHFCPYCLVVHGCGLGLAAMMLWKRPPALFKPQWSAGLGIVAAGLMIGVQALSPVPETFVIETHEIETHEGTIEEVETEIFDPLANVIGAPAQLSASVHPAGQARQEVAASASTHQVHASIFANPLFALLGVVAADGTTTDTADSASETSTGGDVAKPAPRLVPVSGGRKQLNVQQWPVWGNASGKYVIVEMFDYTCSHCRNTHRTMKQAYDQLGGELGVLTLPVPLHRSCNDAATNSSPDRADACEIARLAITVWLIDRSKFTVYHNWLFEQNRTAWEARQYAESLVGADALNAELAKGVASKYISKNVMLYKEAGAGTVPKVVFPTTTLTGEIGSASTVIQFAKKGVDS